MVYCRCLLGMTLQTAQPTCSYCPLCGCSFLICCCHRNMLLMRRGWLLCSWRLRHACRPRMELLSLSSTFSPSRDTSLPVTLASRVSPPPHTCSQGLPAMCFSCAFHVPVMCFSCACHMPVARSWITCSIGWEKVPHDWTVILTIASPHAHD